METTNENHSHWSGECGCDEALRRRTVDVSFEELTNLLKPLVLSEKKNEVTFKPQIVVEIQYEEIQKSTNYSSGYALRFPRLIRLRDVDRDVSSIDTIGTVEDLYYAQRGRG